MNFTRLPLLFAITAAMPCPGGHINAEPLPFTISPPAIEMGAFFSGATVKISGVVDRGSRVIVTISAAPGEERFGRKRRFGPIWLSGGKVRISGVPPMFLVFSAGPVRKLLTAETVEQNHLDERSLADRMRVEPHDPSGDQIVRHHYLALKANNGTYAFQDGSVVLRDDGDAGSHFSVQFPWPKKAPPGAYRVTVYEVRDASLYRQWSTVLPAVRVGFASAFAKFASDEASLYGLAAVLTATLAGFGIDFLITRLFGKKRVVAH